MQMAEDTIGGNRELDMGSRDNCVEIDNVDNHGRRRFADISGGDDHRERWGANISG
ncbi:hypothetical protein OROMI_032836 [Orobanche minor]